MEKSGAQIGAENVAKLEAYLSGLEAAGARLPVRAGKPNFSAIAIACGFDRQVLYKNPAAKALLDRAVTALGLAEREQDDAEAEEKPEQRTDRRDRRIMQLEQQNASLRAENQSLRERLKRLEHVEELMVQTGRRAVL